MGLLLPHYKHLNLTSLLNGCVTYTRRVHVNCVAVTCSRTDPKLTELPSITYRYDLIASIKSVGFISLEIQQRCICSMGVKLWPVAQI